MCARDFRAMLGRRVQISTEAPERSEARASRGYRREVRFVQDEVGIPDLASAHGWGAFSRRSLPDAGCLATHAEPRSRCSRLQRWSPPADSRPEGRLGHCLEQS